MSDPQKPQFVIESRLAGSKSWMPHEPLTVRDCRKKALKVVAELTAEDPTRVFRVVPYEPKGERADPT